MNRYSHRFRDALSGPNPVIQKHLPRLLLKCCHSSFPAGSRGLLGDTIKKQWTLLIKLAITILKLWRCRNICAHDKICISLHDGRKRNVAIYSSKVVSVCKNMKQNSEHLTCPVHTNCCCCLLPENIWFHCRKKNATRVDSKALFFIKYTGTKHTVV